MRNYSILIVGLNCYFGHIREFAINLKKANPFVRITVFTSPLPTEVYNELNDFVDKIIMPKRYEDTVGLRLFARMLKAFDYLWGALGLCLKNSFDIVDIHYPTRMSFLAFPFLKRTTKNVVITPWGSDVLRVETPLDIKLLTKMYSHAKYVTIGKDSQMGRVAIEKFKANPDKMVKLGWGGEFFDYIQENSNLLTTDEAKTRFGLGDRYVITCGYNTQKEQKHEAIINAICEVKDQLPKNLTLLFPFTYGRSEMSDKYTDSIKKKCELMGIDYVAVEEHLDMSDLLKLRMATDIFIHVQNTDAGSRCVMEYVCCNKKLVHGAWIKYAYLEDYAPSCYFPVSKMEELGNVIVKAYQSPITDLPEQVKNTIMERGWKKRMVRWNQFFESIV